MEPIPTFTLRRGEPADAVSLASFGRRLYEQTFGADNDPADLAAYLDATYGVPQQAAQLSDPAVITILAESTGALIGYAQIRVSEHLPECMRTPLPRELWRFYVDYPYHGRGVANALMSASWEAARELGGESLWLSVWERNPRAIAFYARQGFRDLGSTDFWVGSDRQTDRVMVAVAPLTAPG
jgi:diamine N-acetyltransferase